MSASVRSGEVNYVIHEPNRVTERVEWTKFDCTHLTRN
ncbi:hypothetical protein M7I_5336 [Glarea lozoyensis 74030]|uniref:Uncharacterized protein n=1 Tax=Glarea lozoyensis (strain ATCC 74030 / MF5533) TaxID=1104152 RepID=H0ERL6_GLAL7|nr:hypothetical protein M7I_5336 [Glarea lozoyensis 74030]